MARNVLLARPHPFIVSEMSSFLRKVGLTARRLHAADGKQQTGYEPLCGVVISAAVSAESPLTLVEAWRWVKEHHPAVPVIFAALADLAVIGPKLRRELELPATVQIVGPLTDVKALPQAGTDQLLLYVTDRDVTERERESAQAFLAHFKPS